MRMKLVVACTLAALSCACRPEGGGTAAAPQTEEEKTLYAIGLQLGRSVQRYNLGEKEVAMVERGLHDSVTGVKSDVELEKYMGKMGELARSRASARADAEKQKGKAFQEQAAGEAGAKRTASGLIYKELTPGTGEQPNPTDMVKVNYRGTLVDGTEFDSSYKRNQPAQFPLNGVIKCWTEGVGMMKVGGKSKLVCPSEIAYGDQDRPPLIKGGSTLVFEVELLEIVKPNTPPAAAPAQPATK